MFNQCMSSISDSCLLLPFRACLEVRCGCSSGRVKIGQPFSAFLNNNVRQE